MHYDYEICSSNLPLSISLSIDPEELELAMATNGGSLKEAVTNAIIFALVVDETA